ncbi:MAG: hypothetical protein WC326_01555 [Candidatus Delongbacteria bacterium]
MLDAHAIWVLKCAVWVTLNGMLGLFVFMGVFYAIIEGLIKLFPAKPAAGE